MRPDPQLAPLLGLTDAAGHARRTRYLAIDRPTRPGAGIAARRCSSTGRPTATRSAARPRRRDALRERARPRPPNPAVTLRSVGIERRPGGGVHLRPRALGRATRARATPPGRAQERDGVAPIRSDDLFFGAAAGDPQPDWVDLTRSRSRRPTSSSGCSRNLIRDDCSPTPLPRFWYFPSSRKAVVVMTGDEHAGGAAPRARLELVRRRQPAGLLGRRLGVRPRHVLHLSRTAT